jgi:hypothetical protein
MRDYYGSGTNLFGDTDLAKPWDHLRNLRIHFVDSNSRLLSLHPNPSLLVVIAKVSEEINEM